MPSRWIAALPLLLALALAGAEEARAACRVREGYPVFQCGDRSWFAPPPPGTGAVRAVFWQIGYGNESINNAEGGNGTGVAPAGVFSGNDSGLWEVPLIDAAALLGEAGPGGAPEGSLCLGPVNWGNAGIDGCCDDRRNVRSREGQDTLLNPNFDPAAVQRGEPFEVDLKRMSDYPIAVLLREASGAHFAVAAVAPWERPSDRADLRGGHYTLADVVDGEPNPLTGARNVIPWQRAPAIRLDEPRPAEAPSGGEGPAWRFEARWDPVRLPSDRSVRPSEAWRISSPGGGVGVADLEPLVRYSLERVRLVPGVTGAGGLPRRELLLWESVLTTRESRAAIVLEEDSCARVVVHFGREPSQAHASYVGCALGRCGDVGYEVTGPALCVEGPLLR